MTRLQEGMEPVTQVEEFYPEGKHDRRNNWTQEELELFLKLYHEGAKYREISLKTGKGINSVVNKVWALGIKRRRFQGWTEPELVTLIRMKMQKKSIQQISEKLNRSYQSVQRKIRALELDRTYE